MAVQNRIRTMSKTQNEKTVEYKCGEETVKLSPGIIRQYLVSGDGNVTDQEVVMFLNLCRFQHLNPFLREAYLIKFGNQPATMVVGKDAITKRAMRNPSFAGQQAGVVVQDDNTGDIEYRTGSLILGGETIVGGWAKVYVKNYQQPIEAVVSFGEYVGLKKDGSMNGQWARKPATMIRKVALVQALREAFPDDLEGLYDSSEMGVEIDETTMAPVDMGTQEHPSERHPEQETIDDLQQELQLDDHAVDEFPGGF